MLHNCNHNLVHALSERLDSLWRYEQYCNDAKDLGCDECCALWTALKEEDEKHIAKIQEELKKHISEGRFDG